ncbi:hypothetical protein [Halarcobacter bivalviorum]|uniref:hypothetical protein n=1 Tax=Halarcobacter bivalviorum TaxID=663364 RepID=UPI00100C1F3D|nr:hypothetical protein [Halarcobacter bivalviorum]RXK06478.1 hypothetical protein CRU97_04430 [Halarcobacter bivalviorum]
MLSFGKNRVLEERIAILEKENSELKQKLKSEDEVFEEINDVLLKLAKGLCGFKVAKQSNNPQVSQIISKINETVEYFTNNGDKAVQILIISCKFTLLRL